MFATLGRRATIAQARLIAVSRGIRGRLTARSHCGGGGGAEHANGSVGSWKSVRLASLPKTLTREPFASCRRRRGVARTLVPHREGSFVSHGVLRRRPSAQEDDHP